MVQRGKGLSRLSASSHFLQWSACALSFAFILQSASAQQNVTGQFPVLQFSEPYLLLLRDPIVQREINLTPEQLQSLQTWNRQIDGPLLRTRNQPVESSQRITQDLIQQSRKQMELLLGESQKRRLAQIEIWIKGFKSLESPDVIQSLQLSASQQAKISGKIQAWQQQRDDLQKQAQAGDELADLQKRNAKLSAETTKTIQSTLTPDQRLKWKSLAGNPLDVAKLGYLRLQAPELQGDGPWINSSPLKLSELRGKVVVVQFWTFGCINCIHNYPAYQHWQEQFAGKDVVMIGIHTPEVEKEYNVDTLRKKVVENQMTFPIVVDNNQENWNAWGNSMWPAVYLVDKQGDIRGWWQGELNWQGQAGEATFGKRIEELLAEPRRDR